MHLSRYDSMDREARVEFERHGAWLKQMRKELGHASTINTTTVGGIGGSDFPPKLRMDKKRMKPSIVILGSSSSAYKNINGRLDEDDHCPIIDIVSDHPRDAVDILE